MTSLAEICCGDHRSASKRSTSLRSRGNVASFDVLGRLARGWDASSARPDICGDLHWTTPHVRSSRLDDPVASQSSGTTHPTTVPVRSPRVRPVTIVGPAWVWLAAACRQSSPRAAARTWSNIPQQQTHPQTSRPTALAAPAPDARRMSVDARGRLAKPSWCSFRDALCCLNAAGVARTT